MAEPQSQSLTLEEIKQRYKTIKETDLNGNPQFPSGYNHPARELKDITLTNNARLIKKMIDGVGKGRGRDYNRPIWEGNSRHIDTFRWIESPENNFSLSTQRNYAQLLYEMYLWSKVARIGQLTLGSGMLRVNAILQDEDARGFTSIIAKFEKKIQSAKGKREVSDKKKEQQVSTSFIYDVIEGMRANNHEAEALIMDILMLYPYRAEVGTLNLQSLESYKKLKKKGGKLGNYLVVGKRKMMVSRSEYKTSDQYGMIENEITDKDLKKKIRDYIEKYEILENQQVFGYTDNQDVSKKLGYLTKKISGISLGPAAIVKVMLSNSPFKDLASAADFLKEMSRIRGTSLSTLQDVYLHSKGLPDQPQQAEPAPDV